MQRMIFKPSRDTSPLEADPSQLAATLNSTGDGGWVWLDMADPAKDEIETVGALLGFDPLNASDVLDVTLLPKVDDRDHYLFVVLHGVVAGEDQRLRTEELDLFVGDNYLVTAHRTTVASLDGIADNLVSGRQLVGDGPAGLAAVVAEAGSRRYLPLLDALDERIGALEEHAMAADPRTLGESQALHRDVIMLRRTLGPQRDVLRQLSISRSPLTRASGRAFDDVYDHYFRLVESLDAARALLGSVLDIYRGAVAERTNEVMKVLTVFSAILLPLTLIAGLWGMNFDQIPGSQQSWGFYGLLGVMTLLASGLWLYFVRRGFVGGPKLREIPRGVGLGLVHLGAAPLRAVTNRLLPSNPHDDVAGGGLPDDYAATRGDDTPHS